MNIIMFQWHLCTRNIKYAIALREAGYKVFCIYHVCDKTIDPAKIFDGVFRTPNMTNNPAIKDRIKAWAGDILHYHNAPDLALSDLEYYGLPVVYDIHDNVGGQYDPRGYYITITQPMAELLHLKNYLIVPNLYSGPELVPYQRSLLETLPLELVYVGSFYFKKSARVQCQELIKIHEALPNCKIHIHMNDNVLCPLVRELTFAYPRIIFEGAIPQSNLIMALQKYHMGLVLWSDYNQDAYCWPNKFSEYVYAGLPVIVDPRVSIVASEVAKHGIGSIGLPKDIAKNLKGYQKAVMSYRDSVHIKSRIPEIIEFYKRVISDAYSR